MAPKKNTAPGRQPGAAGRGETKIACSPADELVQARYWYRVYKAHPMEFTARCFLEAAKPLSRGQGSVARYLISRARLVRRDLLKQDRREVELTLRGGWLGFICGFDEIDRPIMRAYVTRSGILVSCCFCGRAEQHPAPASSDDEHVVVECKVHPRCDYVVRLERPPLLIPAYIPTKGGAR